MTGQAGNNGFNEQFELLRNRYRERLARDILDLASLAGLLLEGGERNHPETGLESLRLGLHRIVGSAGTFGFPRLSEEARRLEALLDQALRGTEPAWDVVGNDFPERLRALAGNLATDVVADGGPALRQPPAERAPTAAHVLIVQSNITLGRELREALDQFGYRTTLVTASPKLAEVFRQAMPDILVVDADFQAGNETAVRFLERWRERGRPTPPVIFTADADDFELRHAVARAGAEGFYLKPVDLAKLTNRIEGLLNAVAAEPFRVLIVDDDEELGEHYRLVLEDCGIDASLVTSPRAVLEAVHSSRPELVLMDIMLMPGFSGADLARMIRMHDEWASLPIVFLSAETNIDAQISALGQGGDDFITKPIADRHLAAAVLARCRRSRQLSELIARDSLTGLLKHARIKEALAVEYDRACRTGRPASVAMLDIDHFKRVNDAHGHAVGDRVIKSLANLLRHRLRRTDVLGRYGGEEFVAVLPDRDVLQAEQIFDDVRKRLQSLPFTDGKGEFTVTLSAGLAPLQDYPLAEDALNAADGALYAAKSQGRNRVHVTRAT